ncbi:FixH family protein [Paenibacillus tuaregi]|uniref:FixH family protein n=1 Tax=Paenibacillus tuaregi TaxID=1816681 RepID=UPI000B0A9AA7|nr:FixH family protein [Paenibacillus tuaregi]
MRLRPLKLVLAFIGLLMILTACNQDSGHSGHDDMLSPLDVKLTVTPTEGKVNEKISFEAKVTQGGKDINDAKEVTFELWKEGTEKHSKITVTSTGEGKYVMVKSFTESGTYHVISHVTANSQHSMPSADFTVKP